MRFIIIVAFVMLLSSCSNRHSQLVIWIENNSDVKDKLTVATYLNGKLVDEREIQRDTVVSAKSSFKINIDPTNVTQKIDFKVTKTWEQTSCFFTLDTLTKGAVVHANYVEILFKKGYQYDSDTLIKDSIVKKDFYSEIINE